MAGDWIKMRSGLADDPAVIAMAAGLELDEDTIVGKLHRLWSWADQHTTDGSVGGITTGWLDRFVGCPGFAAAMQRVGWLEVPPGGILFPDFDRHNGESAKRRAENTEFKRLARQQNGSQQSRHRPQTVINLPGQTADKSVTTEQDRTEEKSSVRSEPECTPRAKPTDQGSDLKEIRPTADEIAERTHYAAELFRLAKYDGNDGRIFWQTAMLIGNGISEQWAKSAANGAGTNAKQKPPGFFRTTLAEMCKAKGVDLDRQLARVKLPKGRFTGPPERAIGLGFTPRAP
jgi:hypothetical protein